MLDKLSLKQKLFSGILTLCVVVSFTVGVFALQARAADSNLSYDQYKADYYISVGYDRYLSSDFTLPYRSIVEGNRNNIAYQGLINAWQIATFNLSDTVQLSKRKAGIYETFLFDILYKGSDPTNTSEILNKVVKAVESSTMKKVCEFTGEELPVYIRMNLSKMDKNQIEKLGSALKSCDELKGVFKSISTISNVLDYATDVEDLIYKLCKASVIAKLGNEYADVLNAESNRTNDQSMKYACTELASICSNMMTEEQIIALMSSELLATDLTEWALGEIWDKVLENCTSYGLAIKVGQGLGKFFSKILFSTNKVIENYYEMDALYDFENILREVVKSYKSSYSSSKTENNAKHFNAAYEMLLGVYGLGTDVSLEHAKINNEDGVNLFVSYVMNKHDKYEIFKNTMKTIKDELDFIQNYANGDLYNSYLEDCCSTTSNVISLTPVTVNASQEQYVQTNEDLTQNIILLCDRKITNDMTLSSDYETFGNLYFSGGTINLNGYTLTVGGNLIQSSGAMQIHGGTLNVNGDYRIQTFTETINNGEALYTYSSGTLNMTNDYDAVNIEGSFYNESVNFSSLSKGKMEIQGDFYQLSNNSGYSDNFYCSGSHSVVFKGIKEHIIRFDSDSSCFNSLTVEGSAKWSGWLRIIKLESDIIVNTSKINLAYLYLNKKTMTVNGNCFAKSDIDLDYGNLTINGDLIQSSGAMQIHGGTLNVNGDYRIQTYTETTNNGEALYTYSSGTLNMTNDYDAVNIEGSFYNESVNSSSLSKGKMEIQGDFYQLSNNSGYSGNFYCSGSHSVVLNGKNVQRIHFDSTSSHFNNLILTKNKEDGYIFEPNNCWNKIINEIPSTTIHGVKVAPTIISSVCGETCEFVAYVYGTHNPSQEVIWLITGNTSSNTTINSNGLLTIANDETSDKITVTATSTADPTKSASVTVDIYQIKITSTVSNVTVTMAAGETQKLQAIVTGTNNPNQKVIWSVGGNESANTIINENGELTIGNDETAKTIIVRATSVNDPEKYGEFAINIATSDEQKYQIGDTNLDGTINIRDVTAIQRYLVELESFNDEQIALADTNGDGEINIADATHLQMYLDEFDGIVLGKS